MPEIIPFPQSMKVLLLEILLNPPLVNAGWGDQCVYCERYVLGVEFGSGPDFDYAPQPHKPHCLLVRIGLLFPEAMERSPAFPQQTWHSREPFTILLRDEGPHDSPVEFIRCNGCQEEHRRFEGEPSPYEGSDFQRLHYKRCHPALLEASTVPKDKPPACPVCGKKTTEHQLARLGFCGRCEREKRELMHSWIVVFEQILRLPMPIWRSYDEIKTAKK